MVRINAFEIPEIRRHLAQYVTIKTAVSCAQVSKAFSADFIPIIWHTIDFEYNPEIMDLSPLAVSKYGKFIRIVKGIDSPDEVNLLLGIGSKHSELTEIHVNTMAGSYYDLIRQNYTTLTDLVIENNSNERKPYIYLDCLTSMIYQPQSSELTSLSVSGVTITRTSFISVLRCCPALDFIDVCRATIKSDSGYDEFLHFGVTSLKSLPSQAIEPIWDPILVHFPNLIEWNTSDVPSDLSTAVEVVSASCPNLTSLLMTDADTEDIIALINANFVNVTHLVFDYSQLSIQVILAILYNPKWEIIEAFGCDSDEDGEDEILSP